MLPLIFPAIAAIATVTAKTIEVRKLTAERRLIAKQHKNIVQDPRYKQLINEENLLLGKQEQSLSNLLKYLQEDVKDEEKLSTINNALKKYESAHVKIEEDLVVVKKKIVTKEAQLAKRRGIFAARPGTIKRKLNPNNALAMQLEEKEKRLNQEMVLLKRERAALLKRMSQLSEAEAQLQSQEIGEDSYLEKVERAEA